MTVAAILLAAGRSTRFGGDKLAAPIDGLPLADHAARTIATLGVPRFVVVGDGNRDWPGFGVVRNPAPDAGMAGSLALGVAAARASGASAVLVLLADMPFVTVAHCRRLIARHDGSDSIVASCVGARRTPPALFGSAWFDRLLALSGDRGARDLLDRARCVPASPAELADVDTPDDLRARGPGGDG